MWCRPRFLSHNVISVTITLEDLFFFCFSPSRGCERVAFFLVLSLLFSLMPRVSNESSNGPNLSLGNTTVWAVSCEMSAFYDHISPFWPFNIIHDAPLYGKAITSPLSYTPTRPHTTLSEAKQSKTRNGLLLLLLAAGVARWLSNRLRMRQEGGRGRFGTSRVSSSLSYCFSSTTCR